MPTFDIVKKCDPGESFRVASVMGKFDLQKSQIEERFTGNIEIGDDWQVGLIVGASGTGKTTILNELFSDYEIKEFPFSKPSILDDMPKGKSVDDICKTFNSVGFSSPPSWLKPYSVLSNGEKMRAELAYTLLADSKMSVFDEFTSVVDRQVAKIGSFAVQKAIRKTDKKFIAVGCHYDVENWLMPDWVFCTDDMTFKKKSTKNRNLKLKSTRQERNKNIGTCLVSTTI